MNPQTVDFDGFACPACILLTIVSNDAQLKRFVETTDPERLERWFDCAQECMDENLLYILLWIITPIIHSSLEGKTSERVCRWLAEPRFRNSLSRPMSMEKTRKLAKVLANAVDRLPVATELEELRCKLQQLLPGNLCMDLLLGHCRPCGHYPTIASAFESPVGLAYQGTGSSDLMEVDSWYTSSPIWSPMGVCYTYRYNGTTIMVCQLRDGSGIHPEAVNRDERYQSFISSPNEHSGSEEDRMEVVWD
ncbi:hypothetical protein FRC14_006512 [Serendipita sp. 396]|nr:hypothetical protein FRC14_006512 [Serendipita sp. 396]